MTTKDEIDHFDVLILGAGLAGLSCALQLAHAKPHWQIALLTKDSLSQGPSASAWAQGGIAGVLGQGVQSDSFESHIQDTFIAGAGLCELEATRQVVKGAPQAIAWLQSLGVCFSEENGQLHLTQEGGHSHRRIVHAQDATGAAVLNTLVAVVRRTPNITVLENHTLVDLVTARHLKPEKVSGHSKISKTFRNFRTAQTLEKTRCLGAYVLNTQTDQVITLAAPHTVLATGGAGKVYLYTTNPDSATGDGLAAAYRAGCAVRNMEFIQFHPTCLFHPHAKSFLISESVRGEGGRLLLPDGTRFMAAHDKRLELAPRDVVARAIDFEMKKHGLDCVYLDISHQTPVFLQAHFPNIRQRCADLGIDITCQPIPVVPAAHYTCGGVQTDLQGHTGVVGLYAVGEVTYTGLHGANRLASNSLLECLVFARAWADSLANAKPWCSTDPVPPPWDESRVVDPVETVLVAHDWEELRRCMWDFVGIVRSNARLRQAERRIALLQEEVQDFYAHYRVSRDLLELRNLVQVADLIVRAAQARKESVGLHFNRDC